MNKIGAWIGAMRLRTLPLSISGIIVGSALAFLLGNGDLKIFSTAILTTVLFQILSNLANDLGDSQKGTDNADRVGPKRAVQSGEISQSEMKVGVGLFVVLSFIAACLLIYLSLPNLSIELLYFFSILAVLCVLAAIFYTMGKSAYGYSGFGDIMVFIFFGFVSVIGVFSLYGLSFEWLTLLPSITIGAWSTAVLNLNNMRDVENDAASGKRTMVVKIGYEKARKVLTEKSDDLHKLAKALLTYETLSGEEIENLINKNVYPKDKEDIKVEDNDKGSALSSLGLKPKIVH